MSIDKNSMALFVSVVENKSFSKTAKKENIPVSTVSRKISELEEALGVRLLERSTRKLRTTGIGQEYFDNCILGIRELDIANSLISDRRTNVSGRLRISIPPSISETIVIPIIRDFRRLYPLVNIECLVADKYINFIDDGIDLSLRVGELKDSSLVARLLCNYSNVLVASPCYLKKAGVPLHPRDLKNHQTITFLNNKKLTHWCLTNQNETYKVDITPTIMINDFCGIQSAVIDGAGISEIPSIICGQAINNGQLIEILPEWSFPSVKISAVCQSNRNLAKVVRLFRDFCVENFAKHIYTFNKNTPSHEVERILERLK